LLKAEPIPKSKKLLRLEVDIGLEHRTIVSGIGESYKPDDLSAGRIIGRGQFAACNFNGRSTAKGCS